MGTTDLEVVEKLVGHWTRQLEIKHMARTDEDAPHALTAAIAAIVNPSALHDAASEVSLAYAVAAGLEIAVAVMNDPLSDLRPGIYEALKRLRGEIVAGAEAARADAAMAGRSQ